MTSSVTIHSDAVHGSGTAESMSRLSGAGDAAGEGRLQWVDQAKGIGIVLVVFGHVITGVHAAGIRIDEQTFRLTWDAIYAFHIPLFFFLSGLFFPHSWQHRGALGVMVNKVDTLVYPYVLWSLLQGFAQVALSHHVNNPVTIGEVLALLWHPRQEFWFLYALFFTYLIACVLYHFVPQRHRWLLLPAAVLVYFLRTRVPHIAALWYPAWYLLYFLAGALLPKAAQFVIDRKATCLAIAVVLFVVAEIVLHQLAVPRSSPALSAANIIAAGAGITATIVVSAILARNSWSFGGYLGRMSLQIYLLHTIAAGFARIILYKVLGLANLELHLVVGTAVGVGVPLAFAHLLERWRIAGFFSPPPRFRLQQWRAAS